MPPSLPERAFTLSLILILALLCLALVGSSAFPATIYVSQMGQDSHTCEQARTHTTARGTVQAGIACLAGGDTLLIGDGTYHEQISDVSDREHPDTIRPPSGLSWEQPTVIRAQHAHKAILDKPHAGDPYNHVVMLGLISTQYVSLEGLVLDGRGHGACVWMGPARHIRLAGNVIKNCGSNGILGATTDSHEGGDDQQIVGNEIFNIATEQTGPPGAHAIYFTGTYSRMSGNFIHEPCPFFGIHATSEGGGLHDNVIENNRVRGCAQAGIVSQGSATVIRNNLLERNSIGIQCQGNGGQQILHNTIVGWKTDGSDDSYGILDLTGGCTMSNNLILQQRDVSSVPRYIYATSGSPTLAGNLCDGVNPQPCQFHVDEYTSVVIDASSGDFRLKEGLPAIDRVPVLAQVPIDRLGTSRPQGTAADVGAYEGIGGSTPPMPPEPPIPPSGGVALSCVGVMGTQGVAIACTPQGARR